MTHAHNLQKAKSQKPEILNWMFISYNVGRLQDYNRYFFASFPGFQSLSFLSKASGLASFT